MLDKLYDSSLKTVNLTRKEKKLFSKIFVEKLKPKQKKQNKTKKKKGRCKVKGPPLKGKSLPVGGVEVGGTVMYPDQNGVLHPTASAAIESNQANESSMSRGASGGCNQDSSNVPHTPWSRD